MDYSIAAHPTLYNGVQFRSRLEARWAAFFDLVGWGWEYEPIDLVGWVPDFIVKIPCQHSECNDEHVLFAEMKPYTSIKEFEGHECMKYPYGGFEGDLQIPADSSAAFGLFPDVTWWEMAHGAGGGEETIYTRIEAYKITSAWKKAGNIVQWKKPSSRPIIEQLRVCQKHFREIAEKSGDQNLKTVCEVHQAVIDQIGGSV